MPTQCGLLAGKNGRTKLPSNSPGRGIVPERVPAEPLLNSDTLRDGANISAQDRLAPDRLPASVSSARKNPIVWFVVTADLSPLAERL
jgi:hypothetical protein